MKIRTPISWGLLDGCDVEADWTSTSALKLSKMLNTDTYDEGGAALNVVATEALTFGEAILYASLPTALDMTGAKATMRLFWDGVAALTGVTVAFSSNAFTDYYYKTYTVSELKSKNWTTLGGNIDDLAAVGTPNKAAINLIAIVPVCSAAMLSGVIMDTWRFESAANRSKTVKTGTLTTTVQQNCDDGLLWTESGDALAAVNNLVVKTQGTASQDLGTSGGANGVWVATPTSGSFAVAPNYQLKVDIWYDGLANLDDVILRLKSSATDYYEFTTNVGDLTGGDWTTLTKYVIGSDDVGAGMTKVGSPDNGALTECEIEISSSGGALAGGSVKMDNWRIVNDYTSTYSDIIDKRELDVEDVIIELAAPSVHNVNAYLVACDSRGNIATGLMPKLSFDLNAVAASGAFKLLNNSPAYRDRINAVEYVKFGIEDEDSAVVYPIITAEILLQNKRR